MATLERDVFGEPLTPTERLVAEVAAAVGVAGHAALGGAAARFLYVLVTTGL